jgi:integrase
MSTKTGGSITEKRGQMFVVYDIGREWDVDKGKFVRKQKWEKVDPRNDRNGNPYNSRRDAQKLLSKRLAELAEDTYIDPAKITFEAFKDTWVEKYAQAEVRPNTMDQYEFLFKLHIIPYLGDTTLPKITTEHIQGFKSHLQQKGLGPQQVKHGLRLVRQMLNHAIDWGYLRTNPALKVRYPSIPKREVEPLAPKEIRAFFDAVAEEYHDQPTAQAKWRALHLVAIFGGLRIGETLAMRWGNLDRESGQYFVRETWHRPKKGRPAYFDEPKTKSSIAPVDLSPTCMVALEEHHLMQKKEILKGGEKYQKQDLIFATATGGALHDINIAARIFRPVLVDRAGIKKRRLHDLRHTCASLLIHQGESPKYIQKQLRHASIEMTFDIYGHLFPDVNQEAARRLDDTVWGRKNLSNKLPNITD